MNYWPPEITNLSELHMPFLKFLQDLQTDARKTARDMYGLKGTVAHFTTDPLHFTVANYHQKHNSLLFLQTQLSPYPHILS